MGFVSFDRNNQMVVVPALLPAAQLTANATGTAVDTGAFGSAAQAKTVTFVVTAGVITDGTIDVSFEESDASGSGYTAIPAARVFGTSPAFTAAKQNQSAALSVKPAKRYVRMLATETAPSSGWFVTAVAIMERF